MKDPQSSEIEQAGGEEHAPLIENLASGHNSASAESSVDQITKPLYEVLGEGECASLAHPIDMDEAVCNSVKRVQLKPESNLTLVPQETQVSTPPMGTKESSQSLKKVDWMPDPKRGCRKRK